MKCEKCNAETRQQYLGVSEDMSVVLKCMGCENIALYEVRIEKDVDEMTRDDVMRETVRHTKRVGELMTDVVTGLMRRAVLHDESKFSAEEFDSFARETPGLRSMTYGSDEYKAAMERIRPAIEKHYERNSHHPEHYRCLRCQRCHATSPDDGAPVSECSNCNGVTLVSGFDFNEMCLLDLIEMLADWKAATERHADGDLKRSIEQNANRFGYDDVMVDRLYLTAKRLGWVK